VTSWGGVTTLWGKELISRGEGFFLLTNVERVGVGGADLKNILALGSWATPPDGGPAGVRIGKKRKKSAAATSGDSLVGVRKGKKGQCGLGERKKCGRSLARQRVVKGRWARPRGEAPRLGGAARKFSPSRGKKRARRSNSRGSKKRKEGEIQ